MDTRVLKRVEALYEFQMDYFYKEWKDIFVKNYYACSYVGDQFTLLNVFEEAIKSIRLVNHSPEKVFLEYEKEMLFFINRYRPNDDLCKLNDAIPDVSNKLKQIRRDRYCIIFKGHDLDFRFIDPFLEDVQPFFSTSSLSATPVLAKGKLCTNAQLVHLCDLISLITILLLG